jgi:hypothetical protein
VHDRQYTNATIKTDALISVLDYNVGADQFESTYNGDFAIVQRGNGLNQVIACELSDCARDDHRL